MEYCPGGDLGIMIARGGRIPEELAKIYCAEILLSLEYLHKQGIVYRDLKPDNIVLDREGHCRLTDFGLSKEGVDHSDLSQSFVGSIAYMAPEMLTKKGHNRSIDWYLFGVLLFELLTGAPPYFSNNRE